MSRLMRGRLYPQPRWRYERFRLNPYSPLYEGLAAFAAASLTEDTRPELHGPYALPGRPFDSSGYRVYQIFSPEIHRGVFSSTNMQNGPSWPLVVPPPEVLTLTTMIRINGTIQNGSFVLTNTAALKEYNNSNRPLYFWRTVSVSENYGFSEDKTWPLNRWFTYSATFRPGSVSGYLSDWGKIDVTLLSGEWPTNLRELQYLTVALIPLWMYVSDTFVHLRELSLTELDAISDYGNVDLRVPDGAPLILPVRTYWPSVLPVAPSYLKRRSLGARSGTREAAL
jgi:hypothetical protein